jgi:hypothetical protein
VSERAGRDEKLTPQGSIIWYELMTSEAAAAERFYGELVGWRFATHPGATAAGGAYRLLSAPDAPVGGMMEVDGDMNQAGGRPLWVAYFAVDDVDASAERLVGAGGRLLMGPLDLPGVGRVALAADPFGAVFYIMRPTPPPGEDGAQSRSFDEEAIGHCAWNELTTTDLQGALAFYGDQFGIAKGDTMPMGEMGDYQFIHHGGRMIGGAMQGAHPDQPRGWTHYFRVPSIDSAQAKLEAGGGTILAGAHQVPGGDWVLICVDPQGARFGLTGAR